MIKGYFFLLLSWLTSIALAQTDTTAASDPYAEGREKVNQCTPRYHLKCIGITTKEVYADARQGKSTRHWWRMSYIGQACTNKHGKFLGTLYEGFFAIPHYTSMALVNGFGLLVHVFSGKKKKEEAH